MSQRNASALVNRAVSVAALALVVCAWGQQPPAEEELRLQREKLERCISILEQLIEQATKRRCSEPGPRDTSPEPGRGEDEHPELDDCLYKERVAQVSRIKEMRRALEMNSCEIGFRDCWDHQGRIISCPPSLR